MGGMVWHLWEGRLSHCEGVASRGAYPPLSNLIAVLTHRYSNLRAVTALYDAIQLSFNSNPVAYLTANHS